MLYHSAFPRPEHSQTEHPRPTTELDVRRKLQAALTELWGVASCKDASSGESRRKVGNAFRQYRALIDRLRFDVPSTSDVSELREFIDVLKCVVGRRGSGGEEAMLLNKIDEVHRCSEEYLKWV